MGNHKEQQEAAMWKSAKLHINLLVGVCISVAFGSVFFAFFERQKGAQLNSQLEIEFENTSIDVGEIRQGESITAVFKYVNVSSDRLYLASALPSCTCTITDFEPHYLDPGQAETLSLTFKSGGTRGRTQSTCYFTYDVPTGKRRECLLRVLANVVPEIELSTESVVFGGQNPRVSSVVLSPKACSDFSIQGVRSTHPSITTSHRRSADKKSEIVEIVFDPELWTGMAKQTTVYIQTSNKKAPVVTIDVKIVEDSKQDSKSQTETASGSHVTKEDGKNPQD